MVEKVNPSHPDKVADRIAGAIVDLAYNIENNPKVACEVLIGHGVCHIIVETSVEFNTEDICQAVHRITGDDKIVIDLDIVKQDPHLAKNQVGKMRCGDNGIFVGMPMTEEQERIVDIAKDIYYDHPYDGKYILDGDKLVICQSNASNDVLRKKYPNAIINPLGEWTGGTDVDTGATNRKLGSDMFDAVTGGGLHGKDLSKADVSVNIYAYLEAKFGGEPVAFSCAIGDEEINGVPYEDIVKKARTYIMFLGGFERLAEWGLV